jgi:hypothetical protein
MSTIALFGADGDICLFAARRNHGDRLFDIGGFKLVPLAICGGVVPDFISRDVNGDALILPCAFGLCVIRLGAVHGRAKP